MELDISPEQLKTSFKTEGKKEKTVPLKTSCNKKIEKLGVINRVHVHAELSACPTYMMLKKYS